MTTGAGLVRLAGVVLTVALVGAACAPALPPGGSFGASPSSTAPAFADGSASPVPPPGSGGAVATPSGGALRVDASLLRVLPGTVDGVALEPDPTTASQIAADPSLTGSADAIAVALAIRPGTSAGDDLAVASVIHLRLGIFSDAWFETWRTTYDQGACDVAGGVTGASSPVSIGGRTVWVGTCAGDARTYHVHLSDPALIVSITAAGPGRFGELVAAGLAE